MRSRATFDDNRTVKCERHTYNNSGVIISTVTTWAGDTYAKTIEDVQTPGFRKLQKCGEFLPLNPLDVATETVIYQPGAGGYSDYLGFLQASGPQVITPVWHFLLPDPDPSLMEAVQLAAMSSAASEAWDVSTFLAEFSKSYDAVKNGIVAFNTLSHDLARKGYRRWRLLSLLEKAKTSPWKVFQQLWLGARYTVRPIIYDIADACRAMEKLLNGSPVWSKGTGRQVETVNRTWGTGWTNRTAKVEGMDFVTLQGNMTYRAASYCAVDPGARGTVQFDPAVTFYETLPYSFVFDWVLNIGSWVQCLAPQLQGKFLGTSVSVKWELEWVHTYQSRPRAVSKPVSGSFTGAKNTMNLVRYQRFATSGVPFPSVLPKITLPRMIDLATLLIRGRRETNRILRG